MYTIATAGHIDHGKSALVKALTGTDPDRLPEEKRREMTIELGFASFKLSTGDEVGIIDVPGHERFIKTMIAGVGTLDLVVFVVAADDGWMPQSQEHLAILKYLGQSRGLIVLTKVDLVEPDWVELVKSDIRLKTADSFLADAEIIEFAAVDNRNLDKIKGAIESLLRQSERRELLDSARLFVDRAFTIAGTGTVVTGTLREGSVAVGQELVHHPSGEKVRVKNLESFYSHLQKADAGIRLAVGLQSVSRDEISRGDVLYHPAHLETVDRLGVKLYFEEKQAHHVRHNRRVLFLHGTGEIAGKLIIPANKLTTEDGAIIAVLHLAKPVITKVGDRFILRLPTPSLLMAGGVVIDPAGARFKRSAMAGWQLLRAAATMETADLIEYQLEVNKLLAEENLLQQSLFSAEVIAAAVADMIEGKRILKRGKYLIAGNVWDALSEDTLSLIRKFHDQYPHLEAMPLAQLQAELDCPETLFELVIDNLILQDKLSRFDAGVKLKSYSADLKGELAQIKEEIIARLNDKSRPAIARKDIFTTHKRANEVYAFLKQRNQVIEIGDLVFLRETYDRLVSQVVELIKAKGKVTVADTRDTTGTSRKYIMPILEEMDRQQITRRDGDYRVLIR
ncbi:MAG: selenocysteine-specific translation elongation factor [candidate division Zixibacteria bacterium]|nr:selenocysteine-specific translation elongation factor [candidate division Zixibacteria bacterium]